VAVISTSAAHRYWPDGHALGARIRYSPYVDWITVVGIADDVKTNGLASHGGNIQVYLPLAQQEFESDSILIRADDGRAVLSQLRGIVVSTDAGLAIRESGIVRDLYQDAYTSPRFFLSFMSLFALSALGIAALGLAASLAYDVSRRTKEIGVRMALGADTARVRRLVIRDACAPVAGGLALGFLAAFWLTRLLASMLYGVGAHDPLTIGAAACVLLGVAAASAYVPARRATAVDPMIVLRVD
jgi:ABC-type antimicrobial peptide transport system permease subunit